MRVIQDSDDELEEDLEANVPVPKTNVSAKHTPNNKDTSSGAGTGSTESFKRAFAAAHQDEPLSSVTPLETENQHNELPAFGQHPEIPATMIGQDLDLSRLETGLWPTDSNQNHPGMDTIYAALNPVSQILLEPTVGRDLDVQVFEPSSTVPNATYTQQMILDGVQAPILLGSESDGAHVHLPTEDPVPWSQLMKFTPVDNSERPMSSHQGAHHSEPGATPLQTTQHMSDQPASPRDRRKSSATTKDSSLRDTMPEDTIVVGPRRPSVEPLSSQDLRMPTASNTSEEQGCVSKEHLKHVQEHDDDPSAVDLPEENYKPRPSRSRSLKISAQTPIDYSVRPEKAAKASRRRKTTESTASPTKVDGDIASQNVTPRRVRKICEMGFTPTTTTNALEHHNGDVTQTVEWLLNNPTSEDELAAMSQAPRKRKRKSSRKEVSATHEEQDIVPMAAADVAEDDILEIRDSADMSVLANETKSPNVQVVIPMKSPNKKPQLAEQSLTPGSQKSTKRRKTTSDLPECNSNTETSAEVDTITVIEPTKVRKRGRGRPKKVDVASVPEGQIPEVSEGISVVAHRNVLHETKSSDNRLEPEPIDNSKGAEDRGDEETVPSKTIRAEPDVLCSPSPNPPTALENTNKTISAKQTSGSPAANGKVPYRVGLSKRARIAPLLRVTSKK